MKTLVISVILGVALAGCGSRTSSSSTTLTPASSTGRFTMTMAFEPSPPKQGNETISISVKDASGNAVNGAVVKATTNMPAMSMAGPSLTFQDDGDGTYSAVTNMNYRTKWILDVSVFQHGVSGKAEFAVDVP